MFDLLPTVFVGLGDDQEFKTALAAFTSLEDMTWLGDGRKNQKDIKDFYFE